MEKNEYIEDIKVKLESYEKFVKNNRIRLREVASNPNLQTNIQEIVRDGSKLWLVFQNSNMVDINMLQEKDIEYLDHEINLEESIQKVFVSLQNIIFKQSCTIYKNGDNIIKISKLTIENAKIVLRGNDIKDNEVTVYVDSSFLKDTLFFTPEKIVEHMKVEFYYKMQEEMKKIDAYFDWIIPLSKLSKNIIIDHDVDSDKLQ